MPASDTSALARNKERLVFVGACVALGAYLVSWLVLTPDPAGDSAAVGGGQRFVLASAGEASIPGAGAVYAAPEATAYYDESIPARWVEPKVVVSKRTEVTLEMPSPVFPPPPMLLPVPGPAIENSKSLPRWPSFPRAQGDE